jgi:sporulation protein YlmC with PRC-barrel domain
VIRLSELMGQSAVSLATAESVGTVKGVVVRDHRIAAVSVGPQVIPASAIRSFEGDAVTFDDYQPPDEDLAARATDVIGTLVLTTTGDRVGNVVDLELDSSGAVTLVSLTEGTLPGDRLLVVGSYAAIVSGDPGLPPPPPPAARA